MSTNELKKLEEAALDLNKAEEAINGLSYDSFKQSNAYKGLKNSYEHQGQRAMQDTIGQIAARTGGMASSYAATAGLRGYNDYMRTLEDAARNMFNDEHNRAMDRYNVASQRYNTAYNEDRYNNEQSNVAKQQAQSDVLAILATGGTPTQKQLEDAGWYDANARATGEESHLNNVSNLGRAYYTQATATPEPEPEFRPVSTEDADYYYSLIDDVESEADARALWDAIKSATGNEYFADSVLSMIVQKKPELFPGEETTGEETTGEETEKLNWQNPWMLKRGQSGKK